MNIDMYLYYRSDDGPKEGSEWKPSWWHRDEFFEKNLRKHLLKEEASSVMWAKISESSSDRKNFENTIIEIDRDGLKATVKLHDKRECRES